MVKKEILSEKKEAVQQTKWLPILQNEIQINSCNAVNSTD